MTTMNKLFSFPANRRNGQPVKLENYRDQALLIVNTASHRGVTPQYRELEALYQSYTDKGFSVPGLPVQSIRKAGTER
jgi:glutathione peroxidase